jgi:autotransporter-associated beta strand protein
MNSRLILTFSALAASLPSSADAGLIAYDGFDGGTTNGQSLSAIGTGTSSGFTGAWGGTAITTNNAGYTTGAGTGTAWSDVNLGAGSNLLSSPTGGSALGTATNHSRFLRTLAATAATAVDAESDNNRTVWVSFYGQQNGTQLGGVELVNTGASPGAGTGATRFLEGFGSWNVANWNWSDRQTAGTGNIFPVAASNEAFITLQLSYTADATTIRMYVNRTGNVSSLTGVPSVENVILNTSNNRPNFNALSVYGAFKIDEMRVGTTYAATAPAQNVAAASAGVSSWAGTVMSTTGAGTLNVTGTQDVRFSGSAAAVTVDAGGVSAGSGRLEFNSGGHSLSGGAITAANITNLSGSNSVLSNVTARYAEVATGTTLALGGGTLTNGLYGGGTLVKTGTGTLVLDRTDVINGDNNTAVQPIIQAGRNNFSGGITVSQGKLSINNLNALGTTTGITLGDASTGANNVELELNNRIDMNVPVTVSNNGTGLAILTGSNTGSGANATSFLGTVTLNRDVVMRSLVAADRLTFDGKITGTGNITVDGGSRNTWNNAANDFVGNVSVSGSGTVFQSSVVGAGEIIPNGANLNLGAGTIFKLAAAANTTETINALTGSGNVQRHEGVGGLQTLAIGSAGGSGIHTGSLSNGAGPLAVTKMGSGTQTLAGSSNYTGPTLVQGGVLVVDGNIASSPLTVEGGTLGGSGTVGLVTMTSGSIAPGNSPGTLNTGSLTLNGGSLSFEFNGSAVAQYDQINVAGTVTLGSDIPLALSLGYDPVDYADVFTVINNDGAEPLGLGAFRLSWQGTPLNEGDLFVAGSQEFQVTYAGGSGNDLLLVAVPEPSAAAAALTGLALLGLRRRRA